MKIMERIPTIYLRFAFILFGIGVLAFCIMAFPGALQEIRAEEPDLRFIALIFSIYVSAIPSFIAVYQSMKLLNYVEKNNLYSEESVKALNTIESCALFICAWLLLNTPIFYVLAQVEDAPGILLFIIIIILISSVIAAFTNILQKIFKVDKVTKK